MSQDVHPNCHNLLHSVQVIENAWNGCKVLSQIHRYHNCQRNEWNSVSQCTRICSSVQSGARNLCYVAAIRWMSGHKEQIGNNPSKYWFECFNCTFKHFTPFSTLYIDTFVPLKAILEKIMVKYGSAQLLTYLIKCPPDIRRVDTPHHFWNFWKSDFSRQNHISMF